jgi:hypothetical protein
MTSDIAGARPLSPGSGEGRPSRHTWPSRERVSHHRARAAGPVAHDRRLGTLSGVRVPRDLDELGPTWLELDVWLTRSLLRYAARKRSMENTVPRDRM